jgi:hypothetical protein
VLSRLSLPFGSFQLELHGLLVQTTSASKRALLAQTTSRSTFFRPAVKALASVRLYTFFAGFALVPTYGTLGSRCLAGIVCWSQIVGSSFVFVAAGSEMLAALDMVEM